MATSLPILILVVCASIPGRISADVLLTADDMIPIVADVVSPSADKSSGYSSESTSPMPTLLQTADDVSPTADSAEESPGLPSEAPKPKRRQYCYQCLALDCPGDPSACKEIRAFVTQKLRPYFYFHHLPPCPAEDDNGSSWLGMWLTTRPCPNTDMPSEVCTAEKIKVKSSISSWNKDCNIVSHAAVLGCAREKLISSINAAFVINNTCMIISTLKRTLRNTGNSHEMTLGHCFKSGTMCSGTDFCMKEIHAEVEVWNDDEELVVCRTKYGTIIGIIFGLFVFSLLLIGISLWTFSRCAKKPSASVEIVDFKGHKEFQE